MLDKQSKQAHNSRNSSDLRGRSDICFSNRSQLAKVIDSSAYIPNLEQIIELLNIYFLEMYDRPLITIEVLLLEGIWQNKTYSEIALENHYSSTYLTNVAAPKLFKRLSQLVECRITKKNCFSTVNKYILKNTSSGFVSCRKEKKLDARSSDTIYGDRYSFRLEKTFDRDLFLRDTLLFAQLN